MKTQLTNEKNTLILIALLKAHNIRRVIVSPGTTNMSFVASLQTDPYFMLYSCVDERSAAYMACGMAEESGEAVVISCTGATASRNYLSALTEAFYRKLPVLAVTSAQDISKLGQNSPQYVDRRVIQNDVAKKSYHIPVIQNKTEERNYTTIMNDALLELFRNGNGPVHINLTTAYSHNYTINELPTVNTIHRVTYEDEFPEIYAKRIGIFVGAHSAWSKELELSVEKFCENNNAVVFSDHIANYKGKYSVFPNIVTYQIGQRADVCKFDLMIYIGNIFGVDYQGFEPKEVWRINLDGEVRDTFGGLTYVFQMSEEYFFKKYNSIQEKSKITTYFEEWNKECKNMLARLGELPFSNLWIASKTADKFSEESVVHFGIQNSLRCWNFFKGSAFRGYCNTGGFGIDGSISSLIGASLVDSNRIYYAIVGDLSFFYDMNALGNKHIGKNVRILLVNNGIGQQFKNPFSSGSQFGSDADEYIAAAGHFGGKSRQLVRDYAEDLGFRYLSANCKEEYLQNVDIWLNAESEKSIVFEVFTDTNDESEAMTKIKTITGNPTNRLQAKEKVLNIARKAVGKKGIEIAKIILDK